MRPVEFNDDNITVCLCGACPVQARSECVDRTYRESGRATGAVPEDPRALPGMYCAHGRTMCDDLRFELACECPRCLVWARYELARNHYCALGSAEGAG